VSCETPVCCVETPCTISVIFFDKPSYAKGRTYVEGFNKEVDIICCARRESKEDHYFYSSLIVSMVGT
jgi:hypothetical protein